MAIESMKFQTHKEEKKTMEILHTENINDHLCALAEELFKKEMEIGSGNFSHVFRDPEAGIAYKKYKPTEQSKNNVHQEAAFLTKLSGISKEVKVPMPVVSFVADVKRENGRPMRQSVLAMEEIEGHSLDKIFPVDVDAKSVPIPSTFDPDKFFPALKRFIEIMHKEHGVYHRDLFDRNIMIETETGMPVVIDFGDAVLWDESTAVAGEYDAYDRLIIENSQGDIVKRVDKDLDHVLGLEERVRRRMGLTED